MSGMPLMTRVPQNGGSGTGLVVETSERTEPSGSSTSSTAVSVVFLGTRRCLSSGRAAPGTPRLTPMSASMRRRPSKASRA
ncbi:hypothetical protein SMICM17S_11823 [Streptomyces microflavus]